MVHGFADTILKCHVASRRHVDINSRQAMMSSYAHLSSLASSKSPKPFFAYVRRQRELRQEIESIIVDGVEQTQPAVLTEAFRSYFSSTFRNDGGEDPPLNYPANNHMQHFIISAEDVHWQLTHLNTNKSEGADEIHP